MEDTYSRARDGVVLTLDKEIQIALEEACAAIDKGAAVVLDCKTGDILASASFPAVDPNHLDECLADEDAPFVNRALSAYAPGSVFKLFVAAAALEEGVDYRAVYDCTGSIEVDGMEFACYDGKAHGEVNMHTALRKSCNGYFVQLLEQIGSETVLQMVHALGFESPLELASGISSDAGTLPSAQTLQNARARANFSFGQGETTVSPLQLAAAVNAIAAGGVYTAPRLVYGYADTNLDIEETEPHEGYKVMERRPQTACAPIWRARRATGRRCAARPKTARPASRPARRRPASTMKTAARSSTTGMRAISADAEETPVYTIVILEESAGESQTAEASEKSARRLPILFDKHRKKHYNGS